MVMSLKRLVESNLTCSGMLVKSTPVQDWVKEYGLWVKREDLSCPPPGPAFSKTRGVYARIRSRPENLIGVLDTRHSQAGHAVARACQILRRRCVNYYPEFKHEPGPREPQLAAQALGAELVGIPAGRSAILYHRASKLCEALGGYMMPNALKLEETVSETATEVPDREFDQVLIPVSSGTIAAGVIRGFDQLGYSPKYIIHMGYSRSHESVLRYLIERSGVANATLQLVDEGYSYKDQARDGSTPPWPCNPYYDLKAFRWWARVGRAESAKTLTLFWNIG